jgi:hypothetical protein
VKYGHLAKPTEGFYPQEKGVHNEGSGSAQLTTSAILEPMRGRAMDFQFDEKKLKFVQRVLNNRVLFKIVLLFQVPLNFMIGMRLRELNEKSCKVSVPYRWLKGDVVLKHLGYFVSPLYQLRVFEPNNIH